MTGPTASLVAHYRDRLRELRADVDALAWGGLSREAALDVLGNGATPEAIDALLEAARADS
jgi:hypothetical protein